ncbi:MAG: rod shape-determining protein MreC [Candidatus Aminicenantes bacterium]|nr:rod shape-determining protein MreC [Candidatus Aminicenantes bacterium]
MPRFLKERKNALVLAGLMFAQTILLSLQIPLGEEASFFERTAFAVLAPIQNGIRSLLRGGGDIWNRYVYLRRVEAQNRSYRDELFRLRQENTLLRNGLDRLENRAAAAAFLRGLRRAFVLADVIGIDAANPYKSIIIDRGSRHGLRNQMPVVDAQGRLVGRIIAPISAGEATVQLVTDTLSAIGVRGEEHPVSGILIGDPVTGRGWLTYVPASDESLVENEALTTTGFDRVFPPGLRAGTIISVQTDGSLFKKIAIRPAFDFRDLSIVAVLTGPVGENE